MRIWISAWMVCGLLWAAGCQKHDERPGEVAAIVNGQPILSAEVEFIFNQQKIPGESSEGAASRRRAILGDLVRTELLAQFARSNNLDAKDELLVQEKLARRQILASLAERHSAQAPAPLTPEAIGKVMAAHPLAFRERKLLKLETMELVTPDAGLFARLDAQGQKGASLDQLQEIARAAQATTTRGVRSLGTDQLPHPVAKALLEGKPGSVVVVKASSTRGVVLVLRQAVSAPVPDDVAERMVASDFSGRVRREGLARLVDQQLATASITYNGPYAEAAQGRLNTDPGLTDGLPLPAPDTRHRRLLLSAAIATLLALSLALGMQTLSWTARWFRGNFWTPRMAFIGLAPVPIEDLDPVNSRLIPGAFAKLAFGPLLLISLGSTGALIYLSIASLSPWLHLLIFPAGIVLGGIVLKPMMGSRLRTWSQELRWWPPVVWAFLQWAVSAFGVFVAMMTG